MATSMPGKMFHVRHVIPNSSILNTEVILQAMPVIHFVPVQNYLPPKENYECPLYKTNIRAGILSTTGQSTNYILNVSLPTDKDPKFWVLQGTAMVTMLND
jgi:dynein heavy chain